MNLLFLLTFGEIFMKKAQKMKIGKKMMEHEAKEMKGLKKMKSEVKGMEKIHKGMKGYK
jgi:hypothetical protein